jgi:hypothetical protein
MGLMAASNAARCCRAVSLARSAACRGFSPRAPELLQRTTHGGKAEGDLRGLLEALAACTPGGVWSRLDQGVDSVPPLGLDLGRIAPAVRLGDDATRVTRACAQRANNAHTDLQGGGESTHGTCVVFIRFDNPDPHICRGGFHAHLLSLCFYEP